MDSLADDLRNPQITSTEILSHNKMAQRRLSLYQSKSIFHFYTWAIREDPIWVPVYPQLLALGTCLPASLSHWGMMFREQFLLLITRTKDTTMMKLKKRLKFENKYLP